MSKLTIRADKTKPNLISLLACFAFVCIGAIPAVYGLLAGRYLSLAYAALLAVWLCEFVLVTVGRGKINRMTALVLIYILCLACFAALNLYNFRGYLIVAALPLFPVLAYCYYADYKDSRPLQIMAGVLMLLLGITFITTVIGLNDEKYLLRQLPILTLSERLAYYRQNVGNINHIYVASLVVITYLSKFKQLRKTSFWVQLVALVIAVVAFVLVLMGSSGIAVLACLTGVIWLLLGKQQPVIRYGLLVVLVVFFLVGMESLSKGLVALSVKVDNYYFSSKLADVATSLQGGEAVGDVAARTDRYGVNIQVFLQSFCLGVGPQYSQVFLESKVDGHSQILGDMARYGILWLVGFISVFKDFVKSIRLRNQAETIEADNSVIYAVVLLMAMLQPIFSSVEVCTYVFLMVPFLDPLLKRLQKSE